MATVWGTLGQIKPSATTLTAAYTVPALKHSAIQVIMTNVGGGTATVRVSHAIGGAADTLSQYMLYDFSLAAGSSYSTTKIAMGPADVIRAYSSTGDVSFNINGIEED